MAGLGYRRLHDGPFFHEFVTTTPLPCDRVVEILAAEGILSGLPLAEDRMLWCVTEAVRKEELDLAIDRLKEAAQ